MNRRFQVLKSFVRKEILQILRDKRMRIVLFVAPLMQLVIFGVAISTETRNVNLALFAKPHDVLTRDLYQRALQTHWFIPARISGADPFAWIQSSEADAVIVGPTDGLGRSLSSGKGTIQLLINAQNSIRAQAIESYLKVIANSVYHDADGGRNWGGVQFSVRALFNPTMETSMYMVPGVMSMLMCLITILLTSMSVAREKEMGTIETLTAAPIDSWDLMLGKTIPFIILGAVQAVLILVFAVVAFGLPIRGPIGFLFFASLLMITATVAIGLLISTISKSQQQAMLGGFIYLFPSYLLSGLMFPIENMPIYIQPIAYINPLTHYIGLLRNILLVGGDSHYFYTHILVLFVIAIVISFFAFRRFRSMIL